MACNHVDDSRIPRSSCETTLGHVPKFPFQIAGRRGACGLFQSGLVLGGSWEGSGLVIALCALLTNDGLGRGVASFVSL